MNRIKTHDNHDHIANEAFKDFKDQVDITRTRKHLRTILLYYLQNEFQELPPGFGDFIEDMRFTFDFLEKVEHTLKG